MCHRLKRIYILINGEHGVKDVDAAMLEALNTQCEASLQTNRPITMQAIITKSDSIMADAPNKLQQIRQALFEAAPLCLPPIVSAALKQYFHGKDEIRRSIVEACGLGHIVSTIKSS